MANRTNPADARAAWNMLVGEIETHKGALLIVRNWGFLFVAFVLLVVWLPSIGTSADLPVLLWSVVYLAYLLVLKFLAIRARTAHPRAARLYNADAFRIFRIQFNLAMIAILAAVSPSSAFDYLWFFFSMPLLATIAYFGSLPAVALVYLEVCAVVFVLTLAQGGPPMPLTLATMAAKDAILGLLAAILYFFVRLSPMVREQSTLLGAAKTLIQVLDRDELSRVLADAAKAGIHHSEAAVVHLLGGEENRTLVPTGSSHIDLSTLGRSLMRVGEGIAGHAVASRKTINVSDVETDERYHRLPRSFTPVRSLLVAPMYVGDKNVGTISVHSSRKGAFSRRDARFLTMLAAQGAAAIGNAELYGSRTRQRQEITRVLEASLSFDLSQSREALLQAIAQAACDCCGYGVAIVGLLDGTTDRVTVAGVAGVPEEDRPRLLGQGVSHENLKPLLHDDFRISRSHFVRHDRHLRPTGLGPYGFSPNLGERQPGEWHQEDRLVVTIQTQGEDILGYIVVNDPVDRQLPSLDTIQALEILSSVVSTAIQNACLFERAQEEIRQRKQAEKELAYERDLLKYLVDNIPDTIYFKDTASRFTRVNRAQARILGLSDPQEAVGKTDFDFFDADFARETYADEQRIIESGEPLVSKIEKVEGADGEVRWFSATKVPILDNGQVAGIVGVSRDITQRREMEEKIRQRNRELALLTQAGQAFSSTLDLDQVLITALNEVRRLLGVTAASVWLIEPETDNVVCRQATGPKREIVGGSRLPPGEGLVGWAIRHNDSLVVPDARLDERHFKGVGERTGIEIRSALVTPLRVKDDVIGVLQVVDTEVDCFKETDLDFLEPLASNAAIAIANARLYEETDRLRAFNQNIVQSLEEGIIIEDEASQIIFVNPKTTQLLGYSSQELIGQSCLVTVAPEERQKVERENARRRQGIASQYETVMLAKDGRRVPVLVSANPLEENGVFKGVLAVYTDITDAKRRETRLREYLSSVTNKLARHTSLEGLYEFIVNAGARLLSARDCSMFLAAAAGDDVRFLDLVATTGSLGGGHRLRIDSGTGARRGPIARTARTCRPIRLIGDDASGHPSWNAGLWAELGRDSAPRAVHSLLTAPMCLPDGRLVGVLVARDTDVAGGFSELDEELLYTLATDAAAGIERVRDVDRVRDEVIRAERKRLEADLHEAINMLATGVRWEAEILADHIKRGNLDEARQALTRLQAARTRASVDLRYILEDLREPTLEQEGLLAALKKRADLIGHGRIQVHGDVWEPLPPEIEGALYRVGQEAMDNAVKHSGVMEDPGIQIDVILERDADQARLCVRDDGMGFDVEGVLTQQYKWGLRRLRDALHRMGGRLVLDSVPGKGTAVCALVNLGGDSHRA